MTAEHVSRLRHVVLRIAADNAVSAAARAADLRLTAEPVISRPGMDDLLHTRSHDSGAGGAR